MNVLDLAGDGLRHLQIREELVGICEAAGVKQAVRGAAVLHVMARWQAFKIREFSRRLLEKKATSMWIFMSARQMKDECFGLWGETAIRETLVALVELGWLVRRKSDNNPRDRTYHYKLNAPVVNQALWKWYSVNANSQKRECKHSKTRMQALENADASTRKRGTLPQSPYTETSTETGHSKAAVLQLTELGIDVEAAEKLAEQCTPERVNEVVMAAAGKSKPAGWARKMLENGWPVAAGRIPPWKREEPTLGDDGIRYLNGKYAGFLNQ